MTTDPDPTGRFERSGVGERYERIVVPAFFAAWAADLVARAALQPGERALDVGCGTGIVARTAAPRLGAHGRVVGLDAAEEMLGTARAQPPPGGAPIEWRRGDAAALPFPAAAFDAVLCQQALQFVPDRPAALREMRRVLAAGGRLVLSAFRRSGQHDALEPIVARFLGTDGAASLMAPFRLADAEELLALVRGAGFGDVAHRLVALPARFAAADDVIEFYVAERGAALDAPQRAAFLDGARAALAPYGTPEGVVFTMESSVVLARP